MEGYLIGENGPIESQVGKRHLKYLSSLTSGSSIEVPLPGGICPCCQSLARGCTNNQTSFPSSLSLHFDLEETES